MGANAVGSGRGLQDLVGRNAAVGNARGMLLSKFFFSDSCLLCLL